MSNDQVVRTSNVASTTPGSENFTRVLTRMPLLGAAILAISGALVIGAAAADAATYGWAKVSSTGKLLASSGITRAQQFGNGRYNLLTSFTSSGCALTGAINTAGGEDVGPGSGSIVIGSVDSKTLFVRTATPSSTGAATVDSSRPFSVWIACH